MNEFARLVLLIVVSGVALTLLGAVAVWSGDETRRIRRGLRKILGVEPHALIIAPGTGRGAGFNFADNELSVVWDAGAWGLVYRVQELAGAELIVDGQVVGRAHRGETRRAVDRLDGAEALVRLRLVFDDPARPDFDLDLWTAANTSRKAPSAADALEEANRWLARTEALLRRHPQLRPATPVAQPAPAPPPAAFARASDDEQEELPF